MAQRCTKSTKLIEFQFKLLHRRIPTNDFLLKIGRKENDNCTFCNNSSETLIHLFWSCHVTSFLEKLNRLTSKRSSVSWQIRLIEHYCTGLEPHSTEYSCQLNYCPLLVYMGIQGIHGYTGYTRVYRVYTGIQGIHRYTRYTGYTGYTWVYRVYMGIQGIHRYTGYT